ncbi:group 1 truncated hemoglobin [Micromonospora fluostatini]|uniref:Group 1 truncated hemoglobin n=1 Tax=Micromonospora fluostatini TaxID=1629071 RepID=A0ABY2DKS7_9ACTN|nr:group 1 truncated hemoglobin [Micromonospora fluostatini]
MEKAILVTMITCIVIGLMLVLWLLLNPVEPPPTHRASTRVEPAMHERLHPAVLTAVAEQFASRIAADPRLAHYFGHFTSADIIRLRDHHRRLLAQLLGGPTTYTMADLAVVHRRLGVTRDAYWQAVGHFGAVIAGLRIPQDIAAQLLRAIYAMEGHVVTGPTPTVPR